MCMGLSNEAQTFQRFIDQVIRDLDCCIVYVDDVFFSVNEEQHLNDLKTVFKRFNKYGIVLNADKCIFGQKEVKFLGHLVSWSGLSPSPETVETLKNFPLLERVQELRRILAMLNFHHRFLKKIGNS